MNSAEVNFRRVFRLQPDLAILLYPDFRIADVSDTYLEVARVSREAVLGLGFFDVFSDDPDDPSFSLNKDVRASFETVLRTRRSDKMATRRVSRPRSENEGGGFEISYWDSLNVPICTEGEVSFILRRVEEMTAQVMREREHLATEQERDVFFIHSVDLLAVVGNDGFFKRVNPAFEKAMGYSEHEICRRPVVDFIHPSDVNKTKERLQVLGSGTPTTASRNRYRVKDGSYRWFAWNTTPIGSLFYSVGRDITDQVRSEEDSRQLNMELEKENIDLELKVQERLMELRRSESQIQQLQKMDAIGRLAGGIAHDFNNMLGAISLYSDILTENHDATSISENLKNIREVTDKASALTRQLLIFSRKQIIQPQTIQLNPLIQQLEKMLVRLIGENVKIVTKLATDLKNIRVDPSQMEQVILNLVVNARDALPQGGTITLETENVYLDDAITPGHHVLISVSDNGVGMDPETVSKIFEPFFTTKPVGKGTGLGLTTIYGIIKQSHGAIWVHSEPSKGSVFKIYLPVAEEASEFVEVIAALKPIKKGHQTLLLVEDDEKLREGFAMMLRRQGYQVLVASEGVQALDLLRQHGGDVHLLLTDVVIPGINGIELAQQARALRNDLRVLFMSGYTNDALENSNIESFAASEFIQKPFSTRDLLSKIQEILDSGFKPQNLRSASKKEH